MSAVEQPNDADEPVPAEEDDDDDKVRVTNTSCVTGIEHADEFFPRIEVEMQRRSARLAALTLVIIADGAERRHRVRCKAHGGSHVLASDPWVCIEEVVLSRPRSVFAAAIQQ